MQELDIITRTIPLGTFGVPVSFTSTLAMKRTGTNTAAFIAQQDCNPLTRSSRHVVNIVNATAAISDYTTNRVMIFTHILTKL